MYETLYNLLKQEISRDDEQIWKIQNWAIVLSGGTVAACIKFLSSSPKSSEDAIISNPYSICLFVTLGASLINLLLWMVAYYKRKGIIRIGAFLWCIEEQNNMNDGWEHWVFYDSYKTEKIIWKILSDIQFWLGICYLIATLCFSVVIENWPFLLILPFVFLLIGIQLDVLAEKFRDKALKNMKDDLSYLKVHDAFTEISKKHHHR